MNDNETNKFPTENDSLTSEEREEQMADEQSEPLSPEVTDEEEPQEGFAFDMTSLVIGVAFCFFMFGESLSSGNWTFLLYLFAVVIIHEMGHVTAGKIFGCAIQEMQVFFFPFLTYKPRRDDEGGSWRSIKWSLGALPLGGLTVFKSRAAAETAAAADGVGYGFHSRRESPYIEDKPAWQRLLISAAGVLFNGATFLILYAALPLMTADSYALLAPLMSYSLILAILNILPIYPLDGGAILLTLYEMITGRKPSRGFTRICGWIGFVLIVLLFWVFPQFVNGLISDILSMVF